MPVTDSYATAALYRTVISKTDTGSDADIALDLQAVSRWIDLKVGRFFTMDAAPVARVFTPSQSLRLLGQLPIGWAESENPYRWGPWARHQNVDDLAAAPTSIIVDDDQDGNFTNDTALNGTSQGYTGGYADYELWPLNAPLGPEPAPWTMIVLPLHSARIGFLAGQRIQITGQWGWPVIPEAIVRATCHLTGILRLESPRATTRVNEMNQVVSTSRPAQEIIQDLVRRYARQSSVL